MLNIKENVILHPVTFHLAEMWDIIKAVYVEAGTPSYRGYRPTITSGCEGRHSIKPWSKHYTGHAFDFRIRDYPDDVRRWMEDIWDRLGPDYIVLLRPTRKPTHIHVHWEKT